MGLSPFLELQSFDPPRQVRLRFQGKEYSLVNLLIPPREIDGSRKMNYEDKTGKPVTYVDYQWEKYHPYIWELAEWTGQEHIKLGRFATIEGAKGALRRRKSIKKEL